MEAQSLGMVEQALETFSREELTDYINTIHTFSAVRNATSRDDELKELAYGTPDQPRVLDRWALSQPDFYTGNYMPLKYQEPFHPDVESLRILLLTDDTDVRDRIFAGIQSLNNIMVDWVFSGNKAIQHLKNKGEKYDIVVTDFVLLDWEIGAYDVAMHIFNNNLHIPVVLLSKQEMGASNLLWHNIVGQYPHISSVEYVEPFLNYLSNIVATGKAFPNENQAWVQYREELEALNFAIEQEPNRHELYVKRGSLRRRLGDEEGGLADFRKAHELYESQH